MHTHEHILSKIKYCPVCGFADEAIFSEANADDTTDWDSDDANDFRNATSSEHASIINGGDWVCRNCHHEVGAYWYGEGDDFAYDEDDDAASERKLFFSMATIVVLFIGFIYFFV